MAPRGNCPYSRAPAPPSEFPRPGDGRSPGNLRKDQQQGQVEQLPRSPPLSDQQRAPASLPPTNHPSLFERVHRRRPNRDMPEVSEEAASSRNPHTGVQPVGAQTDPPRHKD